MEEDELRDKFAMACLTGILANPADKRQTYDEYADRAYKMADAMIRRRKPLRVVEDGS